jgi:hypothetical protein
MKIWKLSPLDLDFAGWCCSCHKGDAIVRAEDKEEARNIANQRFLILAEKVSSCQETPRSPWRDSSVVKCIELDNSKYSTDGPAGLLEPEDFDI